MYCVFLGKAVQTVNPPNGSVGASQIADSSIALGKLSATGTKDATTFLRGDNSFAVPASAANTPAFEAYLSSNQTIGDATTAKLQIDTEIFDSNGAYDNSTNYRFTPAVAGKYYVYGASYVSNSSASDLRDVILYLKKMELITNNQNLDLQIMMHKMQLLLLVQ
jgi:hypothetical protein